jgi:hypothetical protein
MGMQGGAESGQSDLAGSPFEKVFKTSDTLGNAYKALDMVNQKFPQLQVDTQGESNRIGDELKKRLSQLNPGQPSAVGGA